VRSSQSDSCVVALTQAPPKGPARPASTNLDEEFTRVTRFGGAASRGVPQFL